MAAVIYVLAAALPVHAGQASAQLTVAESTSEQPVGAASLVELRAKAQRMIENGQAAQAFDMLA